MAQYDIDLRDYWRIIKKRKSIVILTMSLMLLFSILFANYQKSEQVSYYSSSATIRIDKNQTPEERVMSMYGFSESDDIPTEVQTIKSFPVMAEVAVRLGYFPDSLSAMTTPEMRRFIQRDPNMLSTVNMLSSMVSAQRYEYTNILTISTMATDPYEARDLAQNVIEVYRDFRNENINQRMSSTINFIQNQLSTIADSINTIQRKLLKYTSENGETLPFYSNSALSRDIVDYQRRKNDLEVRLNATNRMIARLDEEQRLDETVISNVFAQQEGTLFSTKYSQLLNLYTEKDEKLQYLTPMHPEIRDIDNAITATKKMLRDQLVGNRNTLEMQIENIEDTLSGMNRQYQTVSAINDTVQRLEEDKKILHSHQSNLVQDLSDVQIQKSENIDEVTVITPATVNFAPVNPPSSMLTTSFLGLFLGMVIGLVAAFITEALDTSIGTIDDVESYLGVSVVGYIPQMQMSNVRAEKKNRPVEGQRLDQQSKLVIHFAPKSPLAESYRALRTNIQFLSFEKEAKVLLFTSASPREGKTTTIVNLALTIAQSGNRVLLVDADMRKPAINKIFGLERENGLSDILLEKKEWGDCVKTVTDIITGELGMNDIILTPGIDNMHILTCGAIPPNPSELLNSEKMTAFLDEVRDEYDMIVFDSPPVLPTTDPAVLGRIVDGVVFVYAVGKVARGSLKRAKAQMDNVKARIIGVVLNGVRSEVSTDFHDYKQSQYYYSYAEDEESEIESPPTFRKRIGDFIGKLHL